MIIHLIFVEMFYCGWNPEHCRKTWEQINRCRRLWQNWNNCTTVQNCKTNVLKTYEIQRCIYSWRFSFPFFSNESKEGREPFHIWKAECRDGCKIPNMPNMVPKTIVVEISVYQRLHQAQPNNTRWCKCPYELAVGCTCVNKITATE